MKLIKVAAAVLNQTPLDWDGNMARIRRAIAEARDQGVSLLCLPELCITGYGCEDAFHAPGVMDRARTCLLELLPDTQGMIVCVGLPLVHQNGIFNTACLIIDGAIHGFVAKKYLAGDGLHYEPRWFKPWPAGVRAVTMIDGREVPLGDMGFDVGGVKIGFEICEDAWVAKRPGAELAVRGIDIILNPSASHFAFGKDLIRQRFVVEGSRAFSASYVYANLLGCESGRVIYDGGAIIASGGKLLALGPRFSFADVRVTTATIDLEVTRLNQWRSASFRPALGDEEAYFIASPFTYPAMKWEDAATSGATPPAWETAPAYPGGPMIPDWERSTAHKDEEFTRAVTLGLYDYMRKSRSRGFVLSLSGGADSAAVAVMIHLMSQLGFADIGREAFLGKLAYVPGLAEAATPHDVTHRLLTCAYQATRNSGSVTHDAAKGVAEGLNAVFYDFDVDALVQGYIGLIEKHLGRDLTWQTDDVALQNIQARSRGPSVWMLANILNALLLTTSNRSEAAVGYATMDGDTCGGLMPVGGIDKDFLRGWLRHLEKVGIGDLGPMPFLSLINAQQPTAELRPAEKVQTDENDLMPYPILDAIERAAIRDKKMPIEVFHLIKAKYGGNYEDAAIGLWVERFFKLWCQNQWKRERYAPSFHLDDENLDPKTWCRFPILSGNYSKELGELRAHVAAATPATPTPV